MSGVKRVFVEKKKPFAVNAKELLEEIGGYLGIKTITCLLYTSPSPRDTR